MSKATPQGPDTADGLDTVVERAVRAKRPKVGMKSVRSPKHDIDELRRNGDPRLTDADKEIIRDLAHGPELALELAALEGHDPDLAG